MSDNYLVELSNERYSPLLTTDPTFARHYMNTFSLKNSLKPHAVYVVDDWTAAALSSSMCDSLLLAISLLFIPGIYVVVVCFTPVHSYIPDSVAVLCCSNIDTSDK